MDEEACFPGYWLLEEIQAVKRIQMLELERFCSESLEGMGNQLCRCGQSQLRDHRGRGGCVGAPGGLGIAGGCAHGCPDPTAR